MSNKLEAAKPFSYLEISTGHVSKDDVKSLDADAICTEHDQQNLILIVYKYDAGWFVVVPQDEEGDDFDLECCTEAYSDQLRRIMKFARAKGCCLVRFDADGGRYTEDLEVFLW